jgi:hypothetical protein
MTNANTASWRSSVHHRNSLDHHHNLQNMLARGSNSSGMASIQGRPAYGQPFSRRLSCDSSMRDLRLVKNGNAIQGIARKALRGIGALAHNNGGAASSSPSFLLPPSESTPPAQTKESTSEGLLSSEIISQILGKAEEARKNFHETVLNMEAGSEEWRQMQRSMRESKDITNGGLSMAMNCRFMDDSLKKYNDAAKSSSPRSSTTCRMVAHDDEEVTREDETVSTAPSLVSAPDLDHRRHLIRKESLKLIRQQYVTTRMTKEENRQGAAQWVRGAGGGIRNLIAKARVPRRTPSLLFDADQKQKQSTESPLRAPRLDRRFPSSSVVVSYQHVPTSAASGAPRQEEWKVVERSTSLGRFMMTQSRRCSLLSASPSTKKSAGLHSATSIED